MLGYAFRVDIEERIAGVITLLFHFSTEVSLDEGIITGISVRG